MDSLAQMVKYLSCGMMYSYPEGNLENITPTAQAMDFDSGPEISRNDRLFAIFGESGKFFKMCYKSRKAKKPVLLVVVHNPELGSSYDIIVQNLCEKSHEIYQTICDKFSIFFISRAQLATHLPGSVGFFQMQHFDGEISIYVLFIKHGNKISIMSKINQYDIQET